MNDTTPALWRSWILERSFQDSAADAKAFSFELRVRCAVQCVLLPSIGEMVVISHRRCLLLVGD